MMNYNVRFADGEILSLVTETNINNADQAENLAMKLGDWLQPKIRQMRADLAANDNNSIKRVTNRVAICYYYNFF